MRFNRERDCEYTDGDHRSRTEILEEQVAQLQARIHTLESTADPASLMHPNSIQDVPQETFLDGLTDFSTSMQMLSRVGF